MSQSQYIQASVQVEAARELGKLLKPLIQRIIHKVQTPQVEQSMASNSECPVGQLKVRQS